jgi:hypothetical protein
MRRANVSLLSVAGLAVVLAAAGCGSSSSVTGPEEAPPLATGAAVLQGTVSGGGIAASSRDGFTASCCAGSGWTVRIEGTALSTNVDEEGEFILSGVPAGTVTLIFEGPGGTAQLTVSGLVDGQVLSLQVHLSGGTATIAHQEACTPTRDTKITGALESMTGTQLVVGGNPVDASQVRKVWRGSRRAQLGELEVGEKVKVWGTLRGDGVIVAEEIQALTGAGGQETWVTFRGTVQSVGFRALDLHANPNNPSPRHYPKLMVSGTPVKTHNGTRFKWSDGTALDPGDIKVGDQAYVEGWKNPGGTVDASKLVIQCR